LISLKSSQKKTLKKTLSLPNLHDKKIRKAVNFEDLSPVKKTESALESPPKFDKAQSHVSMGMSNISPNRGTKKSHTMLKPQPC
jgi:hypothetical protein